MGRVLHLGPSWHGLSFMWAELAWAELVGSVELNEWFSVILRTGVGFGPSCPAPVTANV